MQNAQQVFYYFHVPKTDHTIAIAREGCGTSTVRIGLRGVLASIQFDHQLGARAGEVHNVPPDRVLSAKSHLGMEFSQPSPESLFSLCLIAPQPSGDNGFSLEHPPPHPIPLRP